ncbi:peptidoglycan-binding protein [Marmoricola sp. URHB0036]|uniref:peptidoglycan-binding protein n=1 Tax=Marmoricola sp. URHB0036 TaxID=1298863 RepID=UPI000422B4C0|nr:peptidoglycan-binding protein [Marmoricola sp. URHB0036]
MTRNRWTLAAAAVLVVAAASGGVVALSGRDRASSAARESRPSTATVERGALSAMVSLDGTLTHRARADGSPYLVVNQARGTYTRLPGVGDEAGCGQVLYRVDDRPVLLLCGTVPAYRGLHMGDLGPDVRQLNQNLHALGYDTEPDGAMFTARTRQALEQLQLDRGRDQTGELALDEAVFLPRPVRITRVTAGLGGPARSGASVAEATSDLPEVQVSLDASQQGAVRRGERALITLPGNRVVRGRVSSVGTVARTSGQDHDAADATLSAVISLDDPTQVRGLDSAPVQVEITTTGVRDALSVPVLALVGKSGGGYAVEVVRGGGRRPLVAVRLGLFDTASGRVQVEGALHPGDAVVVPSS